ncbi:unnamed protein product [Brassica oleracea]
MFHVVSCYGTDLIKYEDLECEISMHFYRVRVRSFTRRIYGSLGRMDKTKSFFLLCILIPGCWLHCKKIMYEFSSFLPMHAMENRDFIRQFIAEYPPPENIGFIPDQFNNLGWNWHNTAIVLSDYVDDTYFNGVSPFGVECDEAFGTITLMERLIGGTMKIGAKIHHGQLFSHNAIFVENLSPTL